MPASGCTAGKDKPVFRHRQSDFRCFYCAAKTLSDRHVQQVGEYGGLKSRGVGIQQEKQRLIG